MRPSIPHLLLLIALATVALAALYPRDAEAFSLPKAPRLERRRGGGGGGRGGGGGGGGGRSSSSGGRSSSTGSTSRSSNAGGFSSSGSGTPKSFGSGSSRSYSGGSSVPYTAGKTSPSGIAPLALGVGALAVIFPGIWLYGAYAYNYPHRARYNRSSNDTIPVICVCQEYSVCGCDENYNETFIEDMYRNATGNGEPKLARISDVNGTRTLVVNGTLENGSTAASGPASGAGRGIEYWSGWWSIIAIVIFMCNM
ncbi:hypothetical protein EX30DRAFT_180466 [Ascodesmis nigricans]|uniref:DUF7732 domain-containing protein n=1 Tax=Ascodesmis nigricans TaxID=341454 RepID=A0A4S2MLC5_9PEZI|nr:hypothetical protein EX30DRAFT_180466 [Ascodesmis nigricans]